MRKLAVAVALASTTLASPVLARDNSWYVGVGAGAMLVEDLDLDIGTFNNAGTLDHRAGYDFEGTVGYDFGGFRAEVEVGFREADIKSGRFKPLAVTSPQRSPELPNVPTMTASTRRKSGCARRAPNAGTASRAMLRSSCRSATVSTLSGASAVVSDGL